MAPREPVSQPANMWLSYEQMNVELRGDHSGFHGGRKRGG